MQEATSAQDFTSKVKAIPGPETHKKLSSPIWRESPPDLRKIRRLTRQVAPKLGLPIDLRRPVEYQVRTAKLLNQLIDVKTQANSTKQGPKVAQPNEGKGPMIQAPQQPSITTQTREVPSNPTKTHLHRTPKT